MSAAQKRRRAFSPPAVTVEIDLSGDELERPSSSKVLKRGRGRPKAAPRSIEFEVQRAPTPLVKDGKNAPHIVLPAHNYVPEPAASNPPPHGTAWPPGDGADAFGNNQADAHPDLESENKTGRARNRTPNENLKEWLEFYLDDYLNTLYDRDAPPTSSSCSECGVVTNAFYRCTSCLGAGILCTSCVKLTHRFNPTHRLKTWDGTSWVGENLSSLDYILCLGHGGKACPSSAKSSKICIGDLNGFTHTRVLYCDCQGALSKPRQLLSAGLFPCTHRHPKSALTFPLLDMYNALTTRSRTSGYKYYAALKHLTKPGFSADVDDRYRELMWTYRLFLYLLQLRRSGHKFPSHPHLDVHPDDQAVDCFACPRPGFNFEWDEVTPEERVWFRFWLSFDGNARSVRKNKRVDPGDICLSDDRAYFPHKQTYKEWTEQNKNPKRSEKPSCDNHKAAQQLSVRWVGLEVTGVGAFSCTRHTCILPRGMVDFFQGELFIYSVYALGALLSHINKRRGGCMPIGITYDVMCHWIVNFYTRAKLLPPSIAIPEDVDLVAALPKWHALGHEGQCVIRWSLDHKSHVGRVDGEALERFWSHLNQHSGSTSEQSPGFRTDTLNNIIRTWNEDKGFNMHGSLPTRYKHAKIMLAKQKAVYEDLTEELPVADIKRWEAESIEPVQRPDGKWTSPLMDPIFDGGFYDTVKAEREKEGQTAHVAGRRPGATRWLSDGIEIELSVRNFNDEAKALGDSPTPNRANALNTKRITLRDRIEAHRKKRELYMEGADAPDQPRILAFFEEDSEEESFDLAMPSSYAPATIEAAGLETLAEVERELRRAMCKEAIQSVKRLLSTKSVTQDKTKKRVRGQVANTRSKTALKEYDAQIHKVQWRYTNSRNALLRLGFSQSDAQFQELTSADLTPLITYFSEYAKRTGHGYEAVSWIWRTSVAPNTKDWQVTALKTMWFRSRETYRRWEEELVILKREMVMTMRSFLKTREMWEWKSASPDITPGMRSYACGRARFYLQHAKRVLVACREQLYDETVTLRWSENWLRDNVIVDGLSIDFVK